ncbi:MAG: type IV pilus assembly protein PilM [Tepidisphaeraceae bacterium]
MATARFAWGIDVGNRALKAVKLVREGDQVRIDDFELIEHETVLSNAGDNRETLIQTALANFVQRHPMRGGVVGVGVSGQSSFARFIKLPPVETKKIPEIVRFEAIQQIPFPLDDVEWSYQLFQHPESPDVEVGIFAMRKELVNAHIKNFTDFDLNVQVVQMNPLAVYNAMQHDGQLQGTTMVIDLGAENTDLIIADNETIWMRSIPIGGNNFTQTLEKAFKLPFTKAEDLKRNAATSKYARQIFQAMRPIFADLVAEIQRSVGFYASVHRDSRIKKAIALGGTFRLPGLQKYLQQNLQMDVERLDRLTAGAPSDPKLVPTFNENLLSVVAAYGLALQAMGDSKITSSLLPQHIRREKMWKEKTPMFGAAAALFVLGTSLAAGKYLFQSFQYESGKRDYEPRITTIKNEATSLDRQWDNEVQNANGAERQLMKSIGALSTYRGVWPGLIGDIYSALPELQRNPGAVQPVTLKQTPRNQRKLLLIDTISTRYYDNLGAILADPDFRRWIADNAVLAAPPPSGEPPPPAEPAEEPHEGAPDPSEVQTNGLNKPDARGFLITIRCTSPYGEAPMLIGREFIGNLLKICPDEKRPKMDYAVCKAVMVNFTQIKKDPARMQKIKQEYDAAQRAQQAAAAASGVPGAGHAPPPAPTPGARPGQPNPAEQEAYKDHAMNESMLDDWDVTVLIAVMLDPPAYTPPPPGEKPAPQASAK